MNELEEANSASPDAKDKNKIGLSRRGFLKLALVAAVSAPFVAAEIEKKVMDVFKAGLGFPGVADEAVSAINKIAEINKGKENPEYRPIDEIVQEGISGFEKRTGKKVNYERSKDYKGLDYYREIIKGISDSIVLPNKPEDILEKYKNRLPYEAQQVYFSSNSRMNSFREMFVEGSGIYARFKKRHPDLIGSQGRIMDYMKYFTLTEEEGKADMAKAKEYVEQKKTESGGQVSSSCLVDYFLEQNEGNLGESIDDISIFLKFMARSDYQTGGASFNSDNVKWFKDNMKDEYKGLSFGENTDDNTMINLIGKPYHTWNLISLCRYFPVEMVQAAGIYRQLTTLPTQGLDKCRADIQTLHDLRKTEQILLSYSK